MNNNYTWEWALDERGFKELDFREYSREQLKKSSYVELYLSPSIHYANCGWDHCVYIELFESILDYCWNHMNNDERTRFLMDVVERNEDFVRV